VLENDVYFFFFVLNLDLLNELNVSNL